MRHVISAAILGAVLAGPAWAVQEPTAGRFDARIRTVVYNPMNVVRIVARSFTSTQITFAPTETVFKVAVGDEEAWQPAPVGNILFLKPVEVRQPSNMQVITQRQNGELRTYQFELIAKDGLAGSSDKVADLGQTVPLPYDTPFGVNFVYPEDARQERLAKWRADHAKGQEKLAETRLSVDYFYGPRNWRYAAQGSVELDPAEVSDNGRLTAMRFPGNSALPTIYALPRDNGHRRHCGAEPDKDFEQRVSYTMRADVAVISQTASDFCLRQGSQVTQVFNLDYNSVGQDPQTGTSSPEVIRQVRHP